MCTFQLSEQVTDHSFRLILLEVHPITMNDFLVDFKVLLMIQKAFTSLIMCFWDFNDYLIVFLRFGITLE